MKGIMTQPMAVEKLSFDVLHPNPLLIVVSGPSGVGKDAVLQELKKRDLSLHFVVTATDRAPRPGEVDGVDYVFVTKERFEQMIARDELLEHARVYQDYKGIPKEQVQQAHKSGKDVILRVDVQGAEKLRSLYPEAVLIFLVPHDVEEWKVRLHSRKTETEESYKLRVETAQWELSMLPMFDYVVVNAQDRLPDTVDIISAIIDAEHHRVEPRKIDL
jgi:guanylate kinase